MAPRLFYIGMGNMGRAMCRNLAEKGGLDQPLILYNRTKQRATDLSQELPSGKAEVADSIEEGTSRADIIFICVSNDTAVESALQSALKADVKGKLFVDCSSIHPDTSDKMAKAVLDAGAQFVASPVFGAPAAANAGQLVAVLAGPKASVDRARPYYKGVTSRAVVDLSDEPCSKATALKVIGNTFILNLVEQLAEAHVLAEKTGLGTEPLHQVIEHMFPGPYALYSARLMSGDYLREDPLFAVDLAIKDARNALSLARGAGTRLYNVETVDRHLASVKERSGEKGDFPAIYGVQREESELKYENR